MQLIVIFAFVARYPSDYLRFVHSVCLLAKSLIAKTSTRSFSPFLLWNANCARVSFWFFLFFSFFVQKESEISLLSNFYERVFVVVVAVCLPCLACDRRKLNEIRKWTFLFFLLRFFVVVENGCWLSIDLRRHTHAHTNTTPHAWSNEFQVFHAQPRLQFQYLSQPRPSWGTEINIS